MKAPYSFTASLNQSQYNSVYHALTGESLEGNAPSSGKEDSSDLNFVWSYSEPTLTVTITEVKSFRAKLAPVSVVQGEMTKMIEEYENEATAPVPSGDDETGAV